MVGYANPPVSPEVVEKSDSFTVVPKKVAPLVSQRIPNEVFPRRSLCPHTLSKLSKIGGIATKQLNE
jgi:hypothetical protein